MPDTQISILESIDMIREQNKRIQDDINFKAICITLPKIEQFKIKLAQFHKPYISTVDIEKIGIEIFYTRSTRTARMMAGRGELKRISDEEALKLGLVEPGNASIAWYERPRNNQDIA
jgi:hypothetical protein